MPESDRGKKLEYLFENDRKWNKPLLNSKLKDNTLTD